MQPMVEFALRALRNAQENFFRIRDKIDIARQDRLIDNLLEDTARYCEQDIARKFSRGYPNHGMVGRYIPARKGQGDGKDYEWRIELLHGYSNLAAGSTAWAMSLVCLYQGRPEHVVVISPFAENEYIASRGRGVQFNQRRVRAPSITSMAGSRVALGLPERWMRTKYLETYTRLVTALGSEVEVMRASGCALLDLAELAIGQVDSAFAMGLDSHDLQVASLLLKESGALMSQPDGSPQVAPEQVVMACGQRLFRPLAQLVGPALRS
ncbi:inositol monophosphatase family protein [Carnimonas nigrificans]|uniref:inositol monophosphatase family protein n=1 Tax=Carnimonas nigrificans TaxID=64323 RepID=UPI000471B8EA|nr:inositol monophosphatase family protein [Carnimonas nigrificans]